MIWLWHSLYESAAMFWEVLWALVLGFAVSATLQVFVSKERMTQALGRAGLREMALATAFGAASSSCSYAAVAAARAAFQKGAALAPTLAFMFASTNLVFELGFVLWLLMGWHFVLAELVGAFVLIAVMWLLVSFTLPKGLEDAARAHEAAGEGDHCGHGDGGHSGHIADGGKWKAVADAFAMDWGMMWKEMAIGFVIAGLLAVLVSDGTWRALFLTHSGSPALRLMENAVVGPVIAVLSFVCSIGNIPLASILWSGGISFGGVIAFIYADLIIAPLILVYGKYYGRRAAAYITLVLFVSMVIAGLVVDLLFGALHLIPTGPRPASALSQAHFAWNYTTWLDIAALVVAAWLAFAHYGGKKTIPPMIQRSLIILALSLLAAAPGLAQAQSPAAGHQRDTNMTMPGMSMNGLGMSSSIDLNDPMSQEASGTAWLPASSPVYGAMTMKNGNMLMVHGAVMPRYTDVGSKRGDRRFDAPNWGMAMFSHPLNADSQIGLRAMVSLDPVTEGGYGYPLLFQTGETWHGRPLHDRQHPHDLLDELAASYSHRLGSANSAYLYLGYPGEPALGPPTYMHRLLAYDLADAPIGHHWQDATHITFGVATAGLNFGSKLKAEASDFTGREPDENRYSFDAPRFDSYSGRLSYNPDANNALQVSYGFIKNAEGDGANQHRITTSWLYNKPLGEDSNFTTALIWGQNNLTTEGRTNSYLAEADYQRGRDTYFTRIENIQKSGHELVLPEENLHARKFTLGEYTLGYVRDLTHGTGIDTGLGLAVTANTKPSALDADYGTGTPIEFQVYLRLHPSRLKGMKMDMGTSPAPAAGANPPPAPAPPSMPGMDMPNPTPTPTPPTPPVPAVTPPAPPNSAAPPAPVTIGTVTATITPAPPRARRKNSLTLTITGSDGKPLVGAALQASVAMTSMDMGTSHPAFKDMGNGRYQAGVTFSMPGPWRVTLTITPPGGGAALTTMLDYAVSP